jgi:nucleoid DNA-binding protein
MNKKEIINLIAEQTQQDKQTVDKVLSAFFAFVSFSLINNVTVRLVRFGIFGTKERKQRVGINPKTGKELIVPKRSVIYFKPSKMLKKAVRGN